MQEFSMYIGGEFVTANETFDVLDPATGEPFARCARGGVEHVDQAVAAARRAFPVWSGLDDGERQRLCLSLADILKDHMPELMELLTRESGKPMGGLNNIGSGMEVGGSIAWTQATAGLSLPVEVIQDNDQARVEVHRKPIGVVGSITPWNWPLMIAIWHVIPALRAGNTVVIKPSENTPVATTRFVELANQVLPAGALNIVTGLGDVGAALTEHPDVDKIVFTGSTPTGRAIMRAASDNLKRLTLELGGNDAGIVLGDIDVKAMAPAIFASCFHNNGQTCAALKRLYVQESIYDELAGELAEIARTTKVGNGLEEDSQLGPLQNKKQLDRVQELADDARAAGGTFIAGGAAIEGPGYFFQPTIVTGLGNGSRLVDEEQFGPIVPMIKYAELDEVIEQANDNPNGLGGSVWSADPAVAAAIGVRLECGSVWVNEHGALQPDAPFGGIKQSGFGVEFGRYGLEEFTSIQTLKVTK